MKTKKPRSGSPPLGTRFAKGTSGNPKGRPKSRRKTLASAFDIIVEKTLTIRRNGVEQEVTVQEALQHRTYQHAVSGNLAACRQVLEWIREREEAIAQRDKRPRQVERKISDDPDNADQALLLLDIAGRDPSRQFEKQAREQLLLKPWAVQMALSRRHGGHRLTASEIAEIERCTSEHSTLRWPRGSER
jgi:hypothetical protein